jgi:hypothetical protein
VNIFLIAVITFILLGFLLRLTIDRLNLGCIQNSLPEEFKGWYDAEKYKKTQMYLRETSGLALRKDTLYTLL